MKVITLEDVGKKFTIKRYFKNPFKKFFSLSDHRKHTEPYWALQNINMEIEQGSIVGIIGRNGAGKTTLLNIIAGICSVSSGAVKTKGRISSILSLGSGFKDELSGIENIYLDGLLLGMTKGEISKKMESIIEFSELDGFLNAPLQTYSQGMILRLGFSIAIHVEFDILLVDEVIFVGDCSFHKKCLEAMYGFKKKGKTMIFSTQSMDFIERICDEVYVLEDGRIKFKGSPAVAVQYYQGLLEEKRFVKKL